MGGRGAGADGGGGAALRREGSLLLPAGAQGPFPAVIMLHGSGADSRDIFWRTGDAEVFLRAGLAVFIYDKRGTGQSGGDWQTATIEDLAGDALAAVRLLRGRAEIKADQVGIFGVSQGGRLTPVVAAGSDEVAFLINVTGAAVPFGVQEMWSAGNGLAGLGYAAGFVDTDDTVHNELAVLYVPGPGIYGFAFLDVDPEEALRRKPEEGAAAHLESARAAFKQIAGQQNCVVFPPEWSPEAISRKLALLGLESFYKRYGTLINWLLWSNPGQLNRR